MIKKNKTKKKKVVTTKLIHKARKQGFITQDEILDLFPDAEDRLKELDDLYDKLYRLNIDVFESITEEEIAEDAKGSSS